MPFHCRFHDQMARNVFSQINVTTLLRCYKMSNNLLFLVPVELSISRQLHGSEVFLSFLLLLLLFSYLIKKRRRTRGRTRQIVESVAKNWREFFHFSLFNVH